MSAGRLGPRGLPRLLEGLDGYGATMTQARHQAVHGPLPRIGPRDLIEAVERSGLRGRGGADFPTAVKLRSVAARRRGGAAVVVNGSETEPASAKDALLLARLPHLVLDGAVLAARAVQAGDVLIKVGEGPATLAEALEGALAVRSDPEVSISLAHGPDGYVTGEETAVVHLLNRGVAKPTFTPPRPFERGWRGRPTLVQNPETLAQLALIARFGPAWFRELGSEADPGSVLITISGAVASPGVYEMAFGTPMRDLLAAAGGPVEPLRALLVGGYFGTWVDARRGLGLHLSRSELRAVGCSLGSGVLVALGASACGLHESARIAAFLAGESAGQCGPCVHGLAAIAGSLRSIVEGTAHPREPERVLRWCAEVRGRGACHHPDGVGRFVESALEVFADELEGHRGPERCAGVPAGLPLGARLAVGSRRGG